MGATPGYSCCSGNLAALVMIAIDNILLYRLQLYLRLRYYEQMYLTLYFEEEPGPAKAYIVGTLIVQP